MNLKQFALLLLLIPGFSNLYSMQPQQPMLADIPHFEIQPNILDAAGNGDLEAVQRFVEELSADLTNQALEKMHSALMSACFSNRPLVVAFLLSLPFMDINKRNATNDLTALHAAIAGKKTSIIYLLLNSGANWLISSNNMGSALDLENRLNLNFIKNWISKREQLFLAIKNGNFPLVDECISVVSLKVKNEEGNTPLHCAISLNKTGLIKRFLALNPTLAGLRNSKGETCLSLALKLGNKVGVLIILCADPNAINAEDVLACLSGDGTKFNMIRFLMKANFKR